MRRKRCELGGNACYDPLPTVLPGGAEISSEAIMVAIGWQHLLVVYNMMKYECRRRRVLNASMATTAECLSQHLWPKLRETLAYIRILSLLITSFMTVPLTSPDNSQKPVRRPIYEGSTQFKNWRFSTDQLRATRQHLSTTAIAVIRNALEVNLARFVLPMLFRLWLKQIHISLAHLRRYHF